MESIDVVIGGAGIIGLSVALELVQAGFRVKVIERARAMTGASWAAAGMLAAEDPEHPQEISELATLSVRLYPEYLSTIERLSGHSIHLRTRNTLQATRPDGEFHCQATATRHPIAAGEAARRIPGLETGSRSLLWLEEASLDPRDLCAALPAAVKAAGVVVEEQTEVLAVEAKSGSVALTTSRGGLNAAAFVNCCGAWASLVQQRPRLSPESSILPKKGQMATVLMEGPCQLGHVVRAPEAYLVPRGDGRIVIGATVESAGFDVQVAGEVIDRLLAQAAELWPPVRPAPVVASWAGLRPAARDGLPLIGSAGPPNYWLATGHFRNGILLAPATGLVMRQLLEGTRPAAALDAFALDRLSN